MSQSSAPSQNCGLSSDAGSTDGDTRAPNGGGAGAVAVLLVPSIESNTLRLPGETEAAIASVDKAWELVERDRSPYCPRLNLPARAWQELRLFVLARDNRTCLYCGVYNSPEQPVSLTCDHIVPLARGGDSKPENLATACAPCNYDKGHLLIEEWRPELVEKLRLHLA